MRVLVTYASVVSDGRGGTRIQPVRVYVKTADHDLSAVAASLAREGFFSDKEGQWIMPAAILSIKFKR